MAHWFEVGRIPPPKNTLPLHLLHQVKARQQLWNKLFPDQVQNS